jgi:hypothetical protein
MSWQARHFLKTSARLRAVPPWWLPVGRDDREQQGDEAARRTLEVDAANHRRP